MGLREKRKLERRERILAAAQELIRATGSLGLSMRALATKAEVSLATPYNLFGSKRAIVLAVLQDVREFHDRFSHLRATDPLERSWSISCCSFSSTLSRSSCSTAPFEPNRL